MGVEKLRNAVSPGKTEDYPDPDRLLRQGLRGLILDVATGTGSFIGFLSHWADPGSTIVGADPSEEAVRSGAGGFSRMGAVPVLARGESLCFPSETFDAVAASNSVHHFRYPRAVLEEMLRVLKPGGLFVLREMFRDGDQSQPARTGILIHHWRARVDSLEGISHNRTLTRRELEEIPGSLGLTRVVTEVQPEMETDPKNPETLKTVEKTVRSAMARAGGNRQLLKEAGKLLRRLERVGYAGASSLMILGVKVGKPFPAGSCDAWPVV